MDYQIVSQQELLVEVCQQAATKPVVMLDTEFVRTRTLFPMLGVVQMYDGDTLSLIDCVAIKDLAPLWSLLANKNIKKVLHAASEDLEVFLHESGHLPVNMTDTQVMAAFLGYPVSSGFARLVEDFLSVVLDKGASRTDWLARPLTKIQQDYAAADVFYLYPLYFKLLEKIEEKDLMQAVDEECAYHIEKKVQPIDLDVLYKRVKQAWRLEPQQLAVLRALCKWRYQQAKKRNLALNFVVRENDLWTLAYYQPQEIEKLTELNINEYVIRRYGQQLISLVKAVQQSSRLDDPDKIVRLIDNPQYKNEMTHLKKKISSKANESHLVPELIGSKKLLHEYLKWKWFTNKNPQQKPLLMRGWRNRLLGLDS